MEHRRSWHTSFRPFQVRRDAACRADDIGALAKKRCLTDAALTSLSHTHTHHLSHTTLSHTTLSHTHTYIHTYMHAYIHTYIQPKRRTPQDGSPRNAGRLAVHPDYVPRMITSHRACRKSSQNLRLRPKECRTLLWSVEVWWAHHRFDSMSGNKHQSLVELEESGATYSQTTYPTYIHTYMYACIHTCMHTYIHTYTYTYIHACMHAYMHTCIHTYIHTYMHACMHACINTYVHA